MTKNY